MLEDQRKKQPGKQDYGANKSNRNKNQEVKKVELVKQADDLIVIRQLKGQSAPTQHLGSSHPPPVSLWSLPRFLGGFCFCSLMMKKYFAELMLCVHE